MDRNDIQKVRDALVHSVPFDRRDERDALDILDAALAADPQPVGEVIAHLRGDNIGSLMVAPTQYLLLGTKLYTAPVPAPQREWACKHCGENNG